MKMLLWRGKIHAAPMAVQFDAYRGRLAHTWRPGGNRNPLQRIAMTVARRQLARMGSPAAASAKKPR